MDSPSGHTLSSRRRSRKKKTKKKKTVSRPVVKPVLIITKKTKSKPKKKKKAVLKKPNIGYSRSRRSQLLIKPTDVYERQMAKRIQKKSGLTHIQVMHLIRKSRETDFDIEHGIDWNLSNDRTEQYEMALRSMEKQIDPIGKKTMRELMAEASMYGF